MKKSKKICALLLALVMVLGLTPMAFAAGQTLTPGRGISAITLTGAGDYTATSTSGYINGKTSYTYNIEVPADVAKDANVTVNFTRSGKVTIADLWAGAPQLFPAVEARASDTYNIHLNNGVGSLTVYAYHGFPEVTNDVEMYVFNITRNPLTNGTDIGNGISVQFGDVNYPATAPECYMTIDKVGNAYNANYKGPGCDSSVPGYNGYYPDILAVTAHGSANSKTIKSTNANMTLKLYNNQTGQLIESGQTIHPSGTVCYFVVELAYGSNAAYKLEIKDGTKTSTINFRAPKAQTITSGSGPSSTVSYLPVGQFANSTGGWGTLGNKFQNGNGYSSTGVSLGALGGYIEFKFDSGIRDLPTNPFGVDFVVYGNAFNGNPEPGAVQVSTDGVTWYELAGSEYYRGNFEYDTDRSGFESFAGMYTGTKQNTNVTYTMNTAGNRVNVQLANFPMVQLGGNPQWMPNLEDYPMGTGPHARTNSNVGVSYSEGVVSFDNVTVIEDSDDTTHYAFGYADITPNGNSINGTAVNPYTPYTTNKVGGDGFDLAWAVNIETGAPVDLSDEVIHYVRVYTASLDNGTFGETSAEVCGIFTAKHGDAGVGVTPAPVIKVGDNVQNTANGSMKKIRGLGDQPCSLNVSGTGNIFINGERVTEGEFTPTATGTKVQIIVQDGDAAPYITWLNLKKGS